MVALPITLTHETVGGQAVLAAGAVWLLLLGPIGCAIAGWLASRIKPRRAAFWSGLVGIVPAVTAVLAVDALVSALTIGMVALALILPLVLGYGIGFASSAIIRRRL